MGRTCKRENHMRNVKKGAQYCELLQQFFKINGNISKNPAVVCILNQLEQAVDGSTKELITCPKESDRKPFGAFFVGRYCERFIPSSKKWHEENCAKKPVKTVEGLKLEQFLRFSPTSVLKHFFPQNNSS